MKYNRKFFANDESFNTFLHAVGIVEKIHQAEKDGGIICSDDPDWEFPHSNKFKVYYDEALNFGSKPNIGVTVNNVWFIGDEWDQDENGRFVLVYAEMKRTIEFLSKFKVIPKNNFISILNL